MFDHWFVTRGAREDARAGLDSIEERIVAELGPRPELDPVKHAEHRRFVAALDRVRIEETREDLVRAEDAAERYASPLLFTGGLVLAIAMETIGAVLITRALGLPPAERLPLGFALATAVVGMTAVTAQRTAKERVDAAGNGPGGERTSKTKRSIATLFVYTVYGTFVIAITVVRLRNAGGEDATEVETLAESAVMLATSLGPAWFAEWLMRLRAPAAATMKRVRVLRRRVRAAEREHAKAQAAVERIAREGTKWDTEVARRRARYRTEHRLENARAEHERKERDLRAEENERSPK